jgi:hypothetical protein
MQIHIQIQIQIQIQMDASHLRVPSDSGPMNNNHISPLTIELKEVWEILDHAMEQF